MNNIQDSIEIISKSKPITPEFSGIYFLIRQGKIVYIGQSVSIEARIWRHRKLGEKDFDSVSFIEAPIENLDLLESIYIHTFKPEKNSRVKKAGYIVAPYNPAQLRALGIEVPE